MNDNNNPTRHDGGLAGAGEYSIVIRYNAVSKSVTLRAEVPDDVTFFGMLEMARVAKLEQRAQAGRGPALVVPAPPRLG
jgi:hypothetical protein